MAVGGAPLPTELSAGDSGVPQRLMVFDGVCVLCSGAVRFIVMHERKPDYTFTPVQSPLGQQVLAEQRRERGQRDASLGGGDHLDVVLAVDVAHDHQLGAPVEVRRGVAAGDRDPHRRELVAHGRVDRGVRATDLVPGGREEPRHRTHAGAADADEVDLHGMTCATRCPRFADAP